MSSSFSDLQNAYTNDNMEELDKMARDINSKHDNTIKKVYKDYSKYKDNIQKNIKNLKSIRGFNYFNNDKDGYLDFKKKNKKRRNADMEGTIISDIYKKKSLLDNDNDNDNDDDFLETSVSSLNSLSESSMSANDILSIDSFRDGEIPSMSREDTEYSTMSTTTDNHNYHINDIDNYECPSIDNASLASISSDEKAIKHASKCKKCRKKILHLMKKGKSKNHRHKLPPPSRSVQVNTESDVDSDIILKDIPSTIGNTLKLKFNGDSMSNTKFDKKSALKEFIIVFVVSLLIVFVIDLVIQSIKN